MSVCTDFKLVDAAEDWAGLRSLIQLVSERWQRNQVSHTIRYYISSLPEPTPE